MAYGGGGVMTVQPEFVYQSRRAYKARFTARFGQVWHMVVIMTSLALVAGGVWALLEHGAIGWVLMGLSGPMIMLAVWWQVDLKTMAVEPNAATIDGVMAADVLGQLPMRPQATDIAEAAVQSRAGQFMAVRLGLTPNVVRNMVSAVPIEPAAVWREALAIQQETGSEKITGAVVIAASIRQFPSHDSVLASMQLDMSDVLEGIRWYERLKALVRQFQEKPLHTGGIARDWSFGYTPTLSRFAQNLSQQVSGGTIMTQLAAHQAALDQMMATFGGGGRQNVALIGPDGAGKSTVIAAFAEALIDGHASVPSSLLYQQVFLLDAAALISAAGSRGELEALVTRLLNEAYASKNIILCLENAQLFFEEGVGSVDLTALLQPILEAGRLRLILAMDQQRFLQMSQRSAGLANAMNALMIAPSNRDETMAIMRDQLVAFEARHKVTYMYQALAEAYRVGDRYVQDMAMPGKALKVLEAAASAARDGLVTAQSVDEAVEKTLGIKIAVASRADERERLLQLEELIHQRMINQSRAVSVVSDAIRRARAGVRNQDRPIGTFLFLGPTGVGKTELAKALADVYFGGEEQIVRLDLNEFVRAEDVARLIADGANDPLSLTAQVRKRPFSVVLLDEIEKAHPQVLTTLLQVLDEGILRDEKNRDISFRDAIIIATSNAGAERIREYIERGYQLEQFEQQLVNELIDGGQFRPEFLNRFDEIVVFRPLDKAELLQVVDLILAGINKTLAPQKIQVAVEAAGKQLLVDAGYDPRLGARPMRRVVQRAVENTVAKQLLAGTVTPGSTTIITAEQIRAIVGDGTSAGQ
ncbi:MAG: AAA family ATPase [Candidatus Saccharibacteria bacterium]|nr:AAA family ATPase [Candidatus Saccharibacteria bacterium]